VDVAVAVTVGVGNTTFPVDRSRRKVTAAPIATKITKKPIATGRFKVSMGNFGDFTVFWVSGLAEGVK
jgi:hypothetical protein